MKLTIPYPARDTACRKLAAMTALWAVIGAGPASAVVVTFSADFAVGTSFVGTTNLLVGSNFSIENLALRLVDLPRFDANLGTLTGVEFGFYSTAGGVVSAYAVDSNPERYHIPRPDPLPPNETSLDVELALDLSLSLLDPSGASSYARSMQLADSCFVRGEIDTVSCSVRQEQTRGLSGVLGLAGVSLTDFIGSDPINLFASMNARLSGACQDDIGDDCGFESANAAWSGVATVAYTYAAVGDGGGGVGGGGAGGGNGNGNAVPEPATGWLAVLALASLAGHGRRRAPGSPRIRPPGLAHLALQPLDEPDHLGRHLAR